jgi:4-alpha-glucanotransferase
MERSGVFFLSRVRIRHVRGLCWQWVVDHREQVHKRGAKERHGSAQFQGSSGATATATGFAAA